jgi:ABC-type multidrug transport system fused ATPase/permease subunit
METIGRLVPGRTTFIIALRLSALRDCDVLLRIDRGMIRKLGPLERGELMANTFRATRHSVAENGDEEAGMYARRRLNPSG